MTISTEEAAYRLETANAIGALGAAVADLRAEVRALRWTMTGIGSLALALLSVGLSYLLMRG